MSDKKQYDVVIVGSGIAGAIIAKTLTHAGKSVLILEAGLEQGMDLDPTGAAANYQNYLNTYYTNPIKVPNSPYPNLKVAPSADVIDIKADTPYDTGYLVQKGPVPFASDNFRGPGGTTLHWLGTTLRMLPNDFKMKSKYGVAVDWPFEYETMKRFYEMAEFEIGVSGNVGEQVLPNVDKDFFGSKYVFPMEKIPQSYMDGVIMRNTDNLKVKLNGSEYKIRCTSTPQGRNSDPNIKYKRKGVKWDKREGALKMYNGGERYEYQPVPSVFDPYQGERCEGNASCVPICPVQAKYNALKTIKSAESKNLTIYVQSVVSKVKLDKTKKHITGIEYKRYTRPDKSEYTEHTIEGEIYVLAGSAIENAKMLLASGAANSSDQVGRNLMDHMVMLTWGLTPEKVYPYRGPGSTTNIPTFRDGVFRKDHTAWISPLDNWGWAWPTGAPATTLSDCLAKGQFGKHLRASIHENMTRQFLLHFECEQTPDPNNRVTIDEKYKDILGNYRPVISYNITDYVRKAFEASMTVSKQIFEASGIKDETKYNPTDPDCVEYNGVFYKFNGAGHIVGTHRMGSSPKDSVVDPDMRCWDHKNLFLAGCGNMPTLGTSNPTLTMAALAFKSAEAILKQLES